MLKRASTLALRSATDRRVHARNDYSGLLQLQCYGDPTWTTVQGLDVSAGGFAFFSNCEMRRGERVSVTVPELESFVVGAVVRHVEPVPHGFLVGIEFDELLPAQLERCLCR